MRPKKNSDRDFRRSEASHITTNRAAGHGAQACAGEACRQSVLRHSAAFNFSRHLDQQPVKRPVKELLWEFSSNLSDEDLHRVAQHFATVDARVVRDWMVHSDSSEEVVGFGIFLKAELRHDIENNDWGWESDPEYPQHVHSMEVVPGEYAAIGRFGDGTLYKQLIPQDDKACNTLALFCYKLGEWWYRPPQPIATNRDGSRRRSKGWARCPAVRIKNGWVWG